MTNRLCVDGTLIEAGEQSLKALKDRGLKAITAESCTAGLVAAILSQAKDAGVHLEGGFVVYSKAQKTKSLGVSRLVLNAEGAVNAKVAELMTTGALASSDADIALAITGVLGPSEDEDGNPVGLVFIATQRRGDSARVQRFDHGPDDAELLRRRVILDALSCLRDAARQANGES